MLTNLEQNYPSKWDEETEISSQRCSVWRKRQSPDNYIEIKYGTPYEVRTGYKVYLSAIDEKPEYMAFGTTILMTFEVATTLLVASAALMTVFTF